jgi:UDP-glucose 4-epimerase
MKVGGAKTKCLVLGGGGFIGSHLVLELLNRGYPVRVFERPNLNTSGLPFKIPQIEWVEGDFLDGEAMESAVKGCGTVFHLISTTLPKSSNDNPIYDIESNLIGSIQLLEILRHRRNKKVIFLSSGGTIYGICHDDPIREDSPTEPICSYGATKLAVEKYLGIYHRLYGLEYRVLRASNPYGERQRFWAGQGAVNTFLYKALKDECIEIWGDGSVVRDFVYVGDVARALLKAADYEGPYRVFNVGSGKGMSLTELIAGIERLIEDKVSCRYSPGRRLDVSRNVLDIGRARTELLWEPETPFDVGLKSTALWMKERVI